jgi:hypothetical protein
VAAAIAAGGGLAVILSSNGVMVSWHGFFHVAVTEQIINAGVPPSNPGMDGTPLNYYWGFHTLIALLATTAKVNPLRVMSAVNVLMLSMTIVAAYVAGKRLLLHRSDRTLVPACLFGAINTGAGLILLYKLLRHGFLPYDDYSDGRWIDWLGQRAIPHRIWDGRVSSFIKEYHDMSGMAFGLCLLVIYFALWMQWRRNRQRWLLPAICLTLFALVVGYPVLAIPVMIHVPIACVLSWWLEAGGQRRRVRTLLVRLLWPACAVLATLPYLRSITDQSECLTRGSPFMTVAFSLQSIISSLTPFWFLLPLVVVGVVCWLPSLRHFPVAVAYCGAAVLLLLACGTNMHYAGQYKFIYGLSLFVALFSVRGWAWMRGCFLRARRWKPKALVLVWVVCLHAPVLFVIGAWSSRMYGDTRIGIVGRDLVLVNDPAAMECLSWVRDETPRDAVVVLPLIEQNVSPSNSGFENPAVARRSAFLVYDTYHSKRHVDYAARSEAAQLLCERGQSAAAAHTIARLVPNRPVFAVIEPNDRQRSFAEWTIMHRSGPYVVLALSGGE